MNLLEAKTLLKVMSLAIPEMEPQDDSWTEIRGKHDGILCFGKVQRSGEEYLVYTTAWIGIFGYKKSAKLKKYVDSYNENYKINGSQILGYPAVMMSLADFPGVRNKVLVNLWFALWDLYKDDGDYFKHFEFIIDENVRIHLDITEKFGYGSSLDS